MDGEPARESPARDYCRAPAYLAPPCSTAVGVRRINRVMTERDDGFRIRFRSLSHECSSRSQGITGAAALLYRLTNGGVVIVDGFGRAPYLGICETVPSLARRSVDRLVVARRTRRPDLGIGIR